MKDPKQILESFRTDVQSRNLYSSLLRQFDLEYPNPRGNRRKPKPLAGKNVNQMAAALSVCLVTGLSAGVGTAFANSDFGPGQHPLDEPPSKPDQKIEQPQSEGKELERKLLSRIASLWIFRFFHLPVCGKNSKMNKGKIFTRSPSSQQSRTKLLRARWNECL